MIIPLPEQVESRLTAEDAALHLALELFVDQRVTPGHAAEIAGTSQSEFLRELNRNFQIDWGAYEAVQRGLSQLIQKENIEEAQALALKLMRKGSYQMACSDEGLMQEEIENCLRPVISAVAESSGGSPWAREMLRRDGTGCICERELTELAGSIQRD